VRENVLRRRRYSSEIGSSTSSSRVARKVPKAGEYEATVRQIFRTEPLAPAAKFTLPL